MAKSTCDTCGGSLAWSWTEAFDEFGFNDGDGSVETWQVEDVLIQAEYAVTVNGWGLHNTVIASIKSDGVEQIPYGDPTIRFGYDDPRAYLPAKIVNLLDNALPHRS